MVIPMVLKPAEITRQRKTDRLTWCGCLFCPKHYNEFYSCGSASFNPHDGMGSISSAVLTYTHTDVQSSVNCPSRTVKWQLRDSSKGLMPDSILSENEATSGPKKPKLKRRNLENTGGCNGHFFFLVGHEMKKFTKVSRR